MSNNLEQIMDSEISSACLELESALLYLLERPDSDSHYDAVQDHLKALGKMADVIIDTGDDFSMGDYDL